jgi:hypothetical protein
MDEDYMTIEHKVWEKKLTVRGNDPTYWFIYEEECGSPTRRARVANLCSKRFTSLSYPLQFSLVMVERLPPQSASFALMDYRVPARALINKDIQTVCNPLLPNYVGNIGMKPVHDMDGPL